MLVFTDMISYVRYLLAGSKVFGAQGVNKEWNLTIRGLGLRVSISHMSNKMQESMGGNGGKIPIENYSGLFCFFFNSRLYLLANATDSTSFFWRPDKFGSDVR